MRGVFLTHPLLFFVVIVVVFVIWGFSLTHLMLVSFLLLFLSGEFLLQLHIPCCSFFYRWCFSYTAHAGFFFIWWVSLTHPMQFLLLLLLFLKGFSYTSRAGFFFMWGSLELLWYAVFSEDNPWRILKYSVGSFSYTSRAGLVFIWGVSFTHPMHAVFFFLVFFFLFFFFSFLFLFFFLLFFSLSGDIPCWLPFTCGELLWYALFSEDNP